MSVMLRCECGFEVTVPDEVATGLVNCPACHQSIDPAVSVIHPSIDDLDPELLLAPEEDDPVGTPPPASGPGAHPAEARQADPAADLLDDLSKLVDVDGDSNDDTGSLTFMDDDSFESLATRPPEMAGKDQPMVLQDESIIDVPDQEGAIAAPLEDASLLSSQPPVIMPPDDDDEGYAVMEEDYGSPAAAHFPEEAQPVDEDTSDAFEAPISPQARRSASVEDDEEISIAEDAPVVKPAKKTSKPKRTGPVDPLDDLLEDDINLIAEPVGSAGDGAAEACPGCQSPLEAGTVLCINCGYNLKLGKKMDGSAGAPATQSPAGAAATVSLATAGEKRGAKTGLAAKLNWSDPRVKIGAAGGAAVLLLAVLGYFLFGGDNKSPSSTGQPAAATSSPDGTPDAASSNPSSLSGGGLSPGGDSPSSAATASNDSASPKLRLVPQGINGKVFSLDLAEDSQLLAVGDEAGNAILYDLEKGEIKQTVATGANGGVNVDLDPTATRLVTGFTEGAKLWSVADGKEERSFKRVVDGAWHAQFVNDGNAIITSGPTGPFSYIDLADNGRTRNIKLNLPAELHPKLAVTPDGRTAVVGSDDGLLAVFDVAAGRPARLLPGHTTKIAAVAISPDGSQALSAAGGAEYHRVGKERWLASGRPIDANVRLWDVATGRELLRWPLPADKPCTCLAFSPDGKFAAVVAEDVRIIDLTNRKLLATIAPAQQGSGFPAEGSSGLPLPTEPFQLAKFFADGTRLATTGRTNGIQIWDLPSEPAPQDLPGAVQPIDLTSYKPAADATVTPLEIPTTSAADEGQSGAGRIPVGGAGGNSTAADAAKALAERQSLSTKAVEVSAGKDKTIAAFRKALAAEPTTVDRLWQLAEICYKHKLMLEAEECLRALLLAQPNHAKAKVIYAKLGKSQPANEGPISPARAWAKPLESLDDAGQRPDPPRNGQYVTLPIDVVPLAKGTKIDAGSVSAKAGDQDAAFLGIYHRPTGEVQGARKGSTNTSSAGQAQVWEAMTVAEDRDGKTVVQFLNRRMPQAEQPRGNQPAGGAGAPKIKMVSDGSRVREDYAGPYEAVFVVPAGESLTTIQWEETLPVYLLGGEPESLEEVAVDDSASTAERLAAIKALGATPGADAAATLDRVIAEGDDKLFAAARDALRQVRRKAGLIAPEFLPVAKPEDARLFALTRGKLDATGFSAGNTALSGGQVPGGTAPINQYSYVKSIWRIPEAGNYRVRIASFGSAPEFPKQQALEFEFTAADANWYAVTAKVDRDVDFDAQLVELWSGDTLEERRFLARNPWDTSSLAAKLKLEGSELAATDADPHTPPGQFGGGAGLGNPHQADAKIDPFADVTSVHADARPLFGKPASELPTLERAVLEELLHSLPESRRESIPQMVVDVARLDTTVAEIRTAALARLQASLGESAPAVFARLAEVATGPAALAAIESLRQLGENSALACRTLIELQTGPAEMKAAAEQAVSDLMTQGIIVRRGTNWQYHGESHFPEQATESENTANTPPAEL